MCTYTFFSAERSQNLSKFVQAVQKWLRKNKFVRRKKSYRKFAKISLCCAREGCSWYTHIAVFMCGIRWRHSRAPNSEPQIFVNFVAL